MKRRELVALIGGAAASSLSWSLAARAQPGKVWRIGMLDTTSAQLNAPNLDAFRRGLRQLGYVEGQNLAIDYRSADGRLDRIPELASELVRRNVDIIVTRGTPSALAAKNATATIPIVMAAIGEPVETGLVASLARPGGNVTGLSAFVTELVAKRVELLREVIPRIARLALLDNMSNRSVPPQWEETKRAAGALGIVPQLLDVRKPEDLERAFDAAVAQRTDALTVGNDSVVIASRRRSPSWRRSFGCRRSMRRENSSTPADCSRTPPTIPTSIAAPRPTSTRFSRARSRPTCRSSSRPNSKWWSASRPPRRSGSNSRRCCSPAPTR
jgi:putative ABC transport system substrate-binding protein